jgi:site-specific DNA recombinase
VKGVSYSRASQDRTGQELSVERQDEDHLALAKLRGWELVAQIRDNDVSASGRRKRPGFEQVLQMVRDGEAEMIVATDMSRLTRGKASDEVRLLELGLETGLKLSFVRAPDLDLSTAAGRLTASILIAAARHEIEQKSERQKRANLQAAQQGRRVGGPRPFGYEPDGMTIREPEAAALRDAYAAVLTGVPIGRIARDWNARGLYTPQAKRDGSASPWTGQTIRPCLLNPRYAGLRSHTDERLRKTMLPPQARIAGIVGPAAWPAIVPESTWRAAVEIITDPSRARHARHGQALLTGIGKCGVCAATVHTGGAPARRGNDGYRTYRCRDAYGHLGRAAEPVEQFVSAVVVERLSRPDARDLLIDHKRPDVNRLRDLATTLRQRRRGVLSLVSDGTYTDAEARDEARKLAEQLAEVEVKLADAGRVDILGPLVKAKNVRAAWDALDVDRQRAVIDTLMEVTLHPPGRGTRTFRPETVGIEWKT